MSESSGFWERLRSILGHLRLEWDRTRRLERRRRTRESHDFSQRFSADLRSTGAEIYRWGPANANYFAAEIADTAILISVFASQKHWWETPSKGFLDAVDRTRREIEDCRWGVVLFRLPRRDGIWIEGRVYVETLEWPEKFTESNLREVISRKAGREFSDNEELMELIRFGLAPRARLKKKGSSKSEETRG